ncbi:MAG: hypothetical protein IBX72_03005 [Nitrospirae bacterium]|jgi:hypothetical protein|nr:hypothetical protein [Nitrospirota bacterium]
MNDVFKDLGISLKGERSVFNFLSNEDLKNLSAFFESKNIRQVRHSGKKTTLSIT